MEKSIWTNNIKLPNFKNEPDKTSTDVLIIGGGMLGLLCAYFLKEKGIDCMLLEKDSVASKTTSKTTGKITCQHNLIYDELIKNYGLEFAKKYYKINDIALKKYKELSNKFPCDFKETKAYTYTLRDLGKIEKELKAYEKIGAITNFERNLELPFYVKGAISIPCQATFHPLKFIKGLSENLNISENTFVKKIARGYIETDKGQIIKAKKIIVATHFPVINSEGFYFLKLYQHRSYFLALKNADKTENMYIDENPKGLSFRSYDDYLIIGGGGHRTGKNNNGYKDVLSFKNQYYKNAQISFKWAAQDTMSLDKIPYIGRYSKNNNDIVTATGFNKWGMSGSMAAAMILCDLVCEKENEYYDLFSPSRSILKPQLFINIFETLANFINPTPKRCSHLGCALKWNKYEHSWDCPCHGSRFDKKGNILDNPANKNI